MNDITTREEAHAALMAAEMPQEAPEAEAVADAPEPQEPEEEQSEAEEAEVAEEQEGEPEGDEEPQEDEEGAPSLSAPEKWDAEDKAWFAELDAEAQGKILKQEAKREQALANARNKAVEAAKAEVSGEMSSLRETAESVQRLVAPAIASFKQRWGQPDWNATLEQYGAEQTMRLKMEYEQDQTELRNLLDAEEQTRKTAHEHYLREEARKLSEIAPALAQDKNLQQKLASFLHENGATQEQLEGLPAWAAAIALDAYLYRTAQAKAKAEVKAPPKSAKPVLKPAAAQSGNPKSRAVDTLRRSFAQTGDRQTAHALLMALEGN